MPADDQPFIRVFTSDSCGRCPAAIAVARSIADDLDIRLDVVDIEEDRTAAFRAGILSVPTVVAGDELIRGVPEPERLRQVLEEST